MKPKAFLRSFLALSGSALLVISAAQADTLYWDGLTPGGDAGGGTGTWDTSTLNWSTAATGGSAIDWDDNDFAIFGGTAATVTLGTGITTSGMQFNVTGYTIIASNSNPLTFAAGNNTISTNFTSAAGNITSINGKVAGTGANLLFTPVNPSVWPVGHIISFGGESSGGWDGSTTIDKNITVRLQDTNQALLNTSSITLRGGMLLLTNTQAGLDRVKDTAPIYSYGGNIRTNNTATDNTAYTETMGALNLEGGHTTLIHNLSNSGGTARSQLMSFSDITRASGSYATLFAGSNGNLNGTTNRIRNVAANGSATDNNKIIGPWFTAGGNTFGSSDYARYDASGNILTMSRTDANLSITSTSTNDANFTNEWTDTANYTTSQIITLSADREINTLRRTGGNNLYLNGNTLATNGILAAGTTNFAINSGNSGTPAGSGTLTAAGGGSNPDAYTLYLQSNVNLALSAAIVDNGSNPVTLVLITGSGRVDLGAANLHTGGTIISAHTARNVDGQDANAATRVELNIAGGLGPNTNLLRVSSGVLDLNANSATVGKFEGFVSGTVTGNSGTLLTVGNGVAANVVSDFAGTLDTISLTKTGAEPRSSPAPTFPGARLLFPKANS